MLAHALVGGVVVDVLLLRVVDASQLGAVGVVVPRVRVDIERTTGSLIELLSLVEPNLVCVDLGVQAVPVWRNAHSLDGTVNELLGVRRRARGHGPNVA